MVLIALHFVLDFFSGHLHHLFGTNSMETGLGLYATSPYLAILIEALFSTGALWYFFKEETKKGIVRTAKNKLAIISIFSYGSIFMLLITKRPFRTLLSISKFD